MLYRNRRRQNDEKALSLILAILLGFSIVPTTVFAAVTDEAAAGAQEAIADTAAQVGAEPAATGDEDYSDPAHPYIATDFEGLKNLIDRLDITIPAPQVSVPDHDDISPIRQPVPSSEKVCSELSAY